MNAENQDPNASTSTITSEVLYKSTEEEDTSHDEDEEIEENTIAKRCT
jgi:hypothetical protein